MTYSTPEGPATDPELKIVERRQDIERTRDQLTESLDELSHRLSPEHITTQAMEGARDMATEAKTTLIETIKSNPLPSALVAGGLYMLFKNRRSGAGISRTTGFTGTTGTTGYRVYGPDGRYVQHPTDGGGIKGAVDGAMNQGRSAMHGLGQATDRVQDTAGDVADRVQDMAADVTDRAQEVGGQLQDRVQGTAQAAFQRLRSGMRQNPLAAALVVAGAGATVGLLIPQTRKEHEVMGDARDQLLDTAGQKAAEVGEKVQRVAEATVETAKQEAQVQARKEGLTTPTPAPEPMAQPAGKFRQGSPTL